MNLFTNKQRQYHIASELAYLYKKEIEKSPKTEVEQWVVEMREIHKKVNDLCEIYLQMRKKSILQANSTSQSSSNSKRKLKLTLGKKIKNFNFTCKNG